MKKLVTIAALLMATTSAHAGGVTFQINGERIHIEAPRHCDALSCIKITAPGFSGSLGNIDLKGLGSKKSDDDDVADTTPAKPTPAPAPVRRPHLGLSRNRRRPLRPMSRRPSPRRRRLRPLHLCRPMLHHPRRRPLPQIPRRSRLRPLLLPPRPRHPPRRSASGPPKRTRATFASSNAAPISVAIRSRATKRS